VNISDAGTAQNVRSDGKQVKSLTYGGFQKC